MSYPNVIQEVNTIKSTYLPLSGGIMTGNINWDRGVVRQNGHSFEFVGDKDLPNQTSFIACRSATHPYESGWFYFGARNKEGGYMGICKPDGTFTWGGDNVITSAGGTINGTLYYGGHDMYCDKNNDIIAIYGSTHHTIGGASLVLHGGIQSDEYGESNISAFKLSTHSYDLSKKKTLYGQYDKGLMWDGNQVVCLVTHWQSGDKWYRKYSNGWIEQGGIWYTSNTTLSFNIAFSNTNYTIVGSENQGDDNARAIKFNRNNATTTSIRMVGSANPIGVCWYACGF